MEINYIQKTFEDEDGNKQTSYILDTSAFEYSNEKLGGLLDIRICGDMETFGYSEKDRGKLGVFIEKTIQDIYLDEMTTEEYYRINCDPITGEDIVFIKELEIDLTDELAQIRKEFKNKRSQANKYKYQKLVNELCGWKMISSTDEFEKILNNLKSK